MTAGKGRTIQEILAEGEPLPAEEAFPFAIELVQVVESLHKQGKILGGIYPDQVLLEQGGLAQVFELAAQRLPEDLTVAYLGFIPPEVLEGQPATIQSDLYSVGIILYVLATGHQPIPAASREELTENILQSRFEAPPRIAGMTQLEWIIKKCLNRVPTRRFASASELLQELRKIWKPVRSARGAGASVTGTITVKKLQRQTRQYQRWIMDHWKVAAGAGVFLLAVILFLLTREEKLEVNHAAKSWKTRALTTAPDVERDPALSPDGSTIAFVSNFTGNWELYVRPLKGGDPTQVTQSPGRESNPRWSPGGDVIMFTYEGPGAPPTIFSVPPSGGIPQQMASDAKDGEWSPDGRSICYVTPAAEGPRSLQILVVKELNTRNVVENVQGLAHPSFSPDGKQIVCEADSQNGRRLFRVKVDSGKMSPIDDLDGRTPSWHWQSGWIYFATPVEGRLKIRRTDPEGFTQDVTQGPGQDFHPVPAFRGNMVLFYREDFSRDVFRLTPGGPMPERISPHMGQSHFPRSVSSASFLFVREQEGKARLELATANGKSNVLMDPVRPGTPVSVSADGAFAYLEDPQEDKKGVWQIALSGGAATAMGEATVMPYLVSPDRRFLFFGSRKENQVQYMRRDLKTQEDSLLFELPYKERIQRAAWGERGNTVIYHTQGNQLASYDMKSGETSTILDDCLDFSMHPRGDRIAALAGTDLRRSSLIALDLRSRKRSSLMSFDSESYAETIDWAEDGESIYYDRFRASSDLYVAE